MKKLFLTVAVVLGMATMGLAQGGMFEKGELPEYNDRATGDISLMLPGSHGSTDDSDGAPLGTGIAVLAGLGAAYLIGKKRKD